MPGLPEKPTIGLHGPVIVPTRQDQLFHLSTAQNEGRENLTEICSRLNILERQVAKVVVVTAVTKDAVVACVLETGLCRQVCGLPRSFADDPSSPGDGLFATSRPVKLHWIGHE